jgi:hypothetical protein
MNSKKELGRQMNEKALEVATKMHDIHCVMRDTYREDFPVLVSQYEPILQAVMKRDNCDETLAALTICRELKRAKQDSPFATMAVIATACEITKRAAIQEVNASMLADFVR